MVGVDLPIKGNLHLSRMASISRALEWPEVKVKFPNLQWVSSMQGTLSACRENWIYFEKLE